MPSRDGLWKQLAFALAVGLLALFAHSTAAQIEYIPMAPPETARFYTSPIRSNVIEIPLKVDERLEYKVRMKAGETIVYSWTVDNGAAYYDFHAESEPDGRDLRYKEEQEASNGHGSLVAPFDGIHGWFWLNLEDDPIVITLRVSGFYELRPQQEQPIGVVKQ